MYLLSTTNSISLLWPEYGPTAAHVYNPESSSVRLNNVKVVKVSFIKIYSLLIFPPSFFQPMIAWGIPLFSMLHCNVSIADLTAFTILVCTALMIGETIEYCIYV